MTAYHAAEATKPVITMNEYAAPSLLQGHHARKAIRDAHEGKIAPLLGVYYGFSSVNVARFMAQAGFDMVWIDWEHSSCSVETMTTIVHDTIFMSGGKTIPFVRVPGHSHADINYVLDAGASVVIPQVNTVEEAKHVVSATKFGLRNNGTRSYPPFRWWAGVSDIPYTGDITSEALNDQAAIMIQIESLEGINNLDAILTACPDIDIVIPGRFDMRANMSLQNPVLCDMNEPEWQEAMATYDAAIAKHNKPHALQTFGQAAARKAIQHCALTIFQYDAIKLIEIRGEFLELKKFAAGEETQG